MAEDLQLRIDVSDDETTTPLLSSTSRLVPTAGSALFTPSVSVTPPQPNNTSGGEPKSSHSFPHTNRILSSPPPPPSPSHARRASTPPLTLAAPTPLACTPSPAAPTLCLESHQPPLSVVSATSLPFAALTSTVSSGLSSPAMVSNSPTEPLLSSPPIMPLPLALHQALIPLVLPTISALPPPTPLPPPPTPPPTPLIVPAASSTVPVIYLRQNTPEASPGASPPVTPTDPQRDLLSSCRPSMQHATIPAAPHSLDTHHLSPNVHDTAWPPPPEGGSDSLGDPPDEDVDDDDEEEEAGRNGGGCAAGLKLRVSSRPSLLIPEKHQRRASQLSTLSVTSSIGRRPSLVSLLSLTPSLAARRFSFGISFSGAQSRVGG